MRVLCALSGGVDSALAAARLASDGAEVVGVHYRTGAVAADPGAVGSSPSCCRVVDAREGGGVRLLRGDGARKDQSYVLASLAQEQLAIARFPLGHSRKEEVRAEARARGLPVADKPDSQELCFVPAGDVRGALRALAPA